MRERKNISFASKNRPVIGAQKGRYRRDPPDWTGRFPNLGGDASKDESNTAPQIGADKPNFNGDSHSQAAEISVDGRSNTSAEKGVKVSADEQLLVSIYGPPRIRPSEPPRVEVEEDDETIVLAPPPIITKERTQNGVETQHHSYANQQLQYSRNGRPQTALDDEDDLETILVEKPRISTNQRNETSVKAQHHNHSNQQLQTNNNRRPQPGANAPEPPTKRARSNKSQSIKPKRGGGLYRRDPPDWKGKFPAFIKQNIFPFLELPVELRAEIYSLLLGGRTIHIDYPGCKDAKRFIDGRPFLCSANITDAQAFAQHGWQPKIPSSRLFFAIRHSRCTDSVAQALTLKLMSLCKQVHSEASPVPFKENCFTFAAPQSIESFLRKLNPEQQRALAHVAVFQTSAGTMWDAPTLSAPLKLPPYLNIKKLTIFVELCPANLNPAETRLAITKTEVQDRMVSRMSVLWSAKLEKVEVMINNSGIKVGDEVRCLTEEEVRSWTARIKKGLLPNADAIEGDDEPEKSETVRMDEELDALVDDSD